MEKFQEDAMRRVRQMQSANLNPQPKENHHQSARDVPKEPEAQREIQNPDKSLSSLDNLFKDKEKLLILLLVMLLSQESYNTELILALLYIII